MKIHTVKIRDEDVERFRARWEAAAKRGDYAELERIMIEAKILELRERN